MWDGERELTESQAVDIIKESYPDFQIEFHSWGYSGAPPEGCVDVLIDTIKTDEEMATEAIKAQEAETHYRKEVGAGRMDFEKAADLAKFAWSYARHRSFRKQIAREPNLKAALNAAARAAYRRQG